MSEEERLARATVLRAAWRRARSAEDLQARWSAAADLLEQVLDANLDADLLRRFEGQARRIADDVARLEPEFAAHWSGALPYRVGSEIAAEVLNARRSVEPEDRVSELFAHLTVSLTDYEGADE